MQAGPLSPSALPSAASPGVPRRASHAERAYILCRSRVLAIPTIDASAAICHEDSPTALPLVPYQNGADNTLVIQQTSPASEQVTIGMNVVAATFSLDANGPYTMYFPANTGYSVVADTLVIASSAAPSTFTIDVQLSATGQIDGGISASNTAVFIPGQGDLTFGGSSTVMVAAMTDFYAKLTINNTVEITDANNSHNGLYIGDPATLGERTDGGYPTRHRQHAAALRQQPVQHVFPETSRFSDR